MQEGGLQLSSVCDTPTGSLPAEYSLRRVFLDSNKLSGALAGDVFAKAFTQGGDVLQSSVPTLYCLLSWWFQCCLSSAVSC